MTKTIYVDVFVFLLSHIYRRHLSPPVWILYPIPNIPFIGENIIFFSNKMFQVPKFEKINITESYLNKFLVNIRNHEKKLPDLRGQNPWKIVELV